jgi:hypothetical protein
MARPYVVLLLLLITPTSAIPKQDSGSRRSTQVRTIPLTRTVKIPLIQIKEDAKSGKESLAMVVSTGAMDEPPEGPNGFDVLDDGSVVITDPILWRLVVYAAGGTRVRSYDVGFSPDSVTAMTDGLILVREANTGQMHVFDREGNVYAGKIPKPESTPQAIRLSAKEGTIVSIINGAIKVQFDEPGLALLSLEGLASDPDLGTFVALETTVPKSETDSIDVRKIVRRYSPSGVLSAETSPIPLDYYVPPVDELRVRKGVIYQLMTTRTEVRINEWDTN